MYLEHFGLAAPPFSITPSTGLFFPGASRSDLLEALVYTALHGDGIIKVTSEVGSGKTMLCKMLMANLPDHVETVYLPNPSISREEVVCTLADELGLDCGSSRASEVLKRVQRTLIEKYAEGKRVLVLIDEAHAMPCESLEELRLLYNLESKSGKLLQIMLFGQTELDEKLALPRMRQLKDRIAHHFSISPLSEGTTGEYLEHRMRAAGFRGGQAFDRRASAAIYRRSRGLMRRINILADKALLAAYVDGSKQVAARHVRMAAREDGVNNSQAGFGFSLLLLLALFSFPAGLGIPVMPVDTVEERLKASMLVLTEHRAYTIRLFEVGKNRRDWLSRFLRDASSSVYVYPVKSGYLVVYGAYSSRQEARAALKALPETSRKAYRPEIATFPFIANS